MGFIYSREGHIWLWVSVCWLNAWISATSDKINISVSAQEFWIYHLWYLYGTIYVCCDKASDWSNSLPSTSQYRYIRQVFGASSQETVFQCVLFISSIKTGATCQNDYYIVCLEVLKRNFAKYFSAMMSWWILESTPTKN